MTTGVYLSLGCNRGDCGQTLARAIRALDAIEGVEVAAVSSVYLTEPVGGISQPDFYNMAVGLRTGLPPEHLLEACRDIEISLGGREHRMPKGPRTIDIDILLYGQSRLATGSLDLPHPRMLERAFMLVPLVEIAPDVVIPGNGKAHEALAALDDPHGVRKDGRLKELEQE